MLIHRNTGELATHELTTQIPVLQQEVGEDLPDAQVVWPSTSCSKQLQRASLELWRQRRWPNERCDPCHDDAILVGQSGRTERLKACDKLRGLRELQFVREEPQALLSQSDPALIDWPIGNERFERNQARLERWTLFGQQHLGH
jgi:hypothetical protein